MVKQFLFRVFRAFRGDKFRLFFVFDFASRDPIPDRRLFNPNSEIEMGEVRQDVGAKTVWKNRSHARSGLVRFFQAVYAQLMDADCPFLFRSSGSNWQNLPF